MHCHLHFLMCLNPLCTVMTFGSLLGVSSSPDSLPPALLSLLPSSTSGIWSAASWGPFSTGCVCGWKFSQGHILQVIWSWSIPVKGRCAECVSIIIIHFFTEFSRPCLHSTKSSAVACMWHCPQQHRSTADCTFILVNADFNHVNVSRTLIDFKQYVTCNTRQNKTLDMLFANIKDAYRSTTRGLWSQLG